MSVLLQPPPTAEELALKEQVTQVLTSQGVLAKIKAELRAAVFEVMHEREGFAKKKDPMAPKLSDFPMETRTTALSLIVECLQFFHWENTLRVLLAETDAEDEQYDSIQLAPKLGLPSTSSLKMPSLFQLIESQVVQVKQTTSSALPASTLKHKKFDDEDKEEQTQGALEQTAKSWEQEKVELPLPSTEFDRTEIETSKSEVKDEDDKDEGESSAEIEESMAEEVPSGSEMEESNYTNYEDEESHDRSTPDNKQLSIQKPQEGSQHDNKQHVDERESDDEDDVSLQAPPPAPAKLPALPPLVSTPEITRAEDAEDDFDAEEESERLRKLDAALQAMEAEDDTGTLQQLKVSLQVELQEQDSFGGRRADDEDEAATSKAGDSRGGDDYGYGSSDFEEEEIASDISEEMESMMESMPEPSDKEDESQDGAAVSAAEAEPPHALRNDTRVDSEDALNSYDYIEDVKKTEW